MGTKIVRCSLCTQLPESRGFHFGKTGLLCPTGSKAGSNRWRANRYRAQTGTAYHFIPHTSSFTEKLTAAAWSVVFADSLNHLGPWHPQPAVIQLIMQMPDIDHANAGWKWWRCFTRIQTESQIIVGPKAGRFRSVLMKETNNELLHA